MPLYTADALVLRTYKLGEADRIVVFLTRDRGKKRGVAQGRAAAAVAVRGALEPLTEVRVAYFEKERRELVGLNYAEPVRSPLSAAEPGGARLQPLLRRADRRVGAGRRRGRAAVSGSAPRCSRRWRRGAPVEAAGAVLRVLAAAAAGRVSGGPATLSSGARGVSRRRARASAPRDVGVARRRERACCGSSSWCIAALIAMHLEKEPRSPFAC